MATKKSPGFFTEATLALLASRVTGRAAAEHRWARPDVRPVVEEVCGEDYKSLVDVVTDRALHALERIQASKKADKDNPMYRRLSGQ